MKCKCGFKFSKAGEFRNCDAFITTNGRSGIICPACNRHYVDEIEIKITGTTYPKKEIPKKIAKQFKELENADIQGNTIPASKIKSFGKFEKTISIADVEEAISFIEQTKSKAWKCAEDADEFEDALAFLRKRLVKNK